MRAYLGQLVSVESGEGVDRVEADLRGGVAGLARSVRRGNQAARRDHGVRPREGDRFTIQITHIKFLENNSLTT